MGVVNSWREMVDLPAGVFEDALLVMMAESQELKRQREKAAHAAPGRGRRR